MGKTLLISVLFFVIVNTILETEVKRKNASKLLSNLFAMFSDITIISIIFVFMVTIIACTQKVSKF